MSIMNVCVERRVDTYGNSTKIGKESLFLLQNGSVDCKQVPESPVSDISDCVITFKWDRHKPSEVENFTLFQIWMCVDLLIKNPPWVYVNHFPHGVRPCGSILMTKICIGAIY